MRDNALLDVQNLIVDFRGRGFRPRSFRALHNVSLRIGRGQTHGLVGESGSGKTTLGRAILGLAPVTDGKITLGGEPLQRQTSAQRRSLAGRVQAIFQDPYSSLNPAMTIEQILAEPLRARAVSRHDARMQIQNLLERVSLPRQAAHKLAHEFSGGQRQRIAIARALALGPELIVCDEPVSALDLTTQETILKLLVEIQQDTNVSYLFISHDLAVVRHISHDISVITGGRIVEQGPALQVTDDPQHAYTKRLLMSSPLPDPDEQRMRRQQRQQEFQTPNINDKLEELTS